MAKEREKAELCRDITRLYTELDPYGTDDAKEFGETDEEFAERMTHEMMSWDNLEEELRFILANLEDMTENGSTEAGKVDALKARFTDIFNEG